MMIAPDQFFQCPDCGNVLRRGRLYSGNTFGATCYSDGYMVAPMYRQFPQVVKCDKCEAMLWVDDLKEIVAQPEIDYDPHDDPRLAEAEEVDFPDNDDLFRALDTLDPNHKDAADRELYIRRHIWYNYNHHVGNPSFRREAGVNVRSYGTLAELEAWERNCEELIYLIKPRLKENANFLCTLIELHRNLCRFDAARQMLDLLADDSFADFRRATLRECERRNPLTVELLSEKEEKEEEKRKTEGKHFTTPWLTYIAEQRKTLLTIPAPLREQIAAAEAAADQAAAAEAAANQAAARNTLLFYQALAEHGDPYIQYIVGSLYLTDSLLDIPQASKYLLFAAQQGVTEALDKLDEYSPDDGEGRWDAWV
jgi:hypothetical protein